MKKNTPKKSKQFDELEVYRHLRTNIEYSSVDTKVQVVNITSSNPGEGKTTTSSNLAIVSANQFSKVLLVDCDMRKPQIHKKFNMLPKKYLDELEDALNKLAS